MDVITSFCFAQSISAIEAPGFRAPIIEAMEASGPAFVVFRNFSLLRKLVFNMPPWLSKRTSPETAGLIQLQQILGKQVKDVTTHPELLEGAPHPIIYHELLTPSKKTGGVPSPGSLYEEAQALMFAGADTVGNTLFLGIFQILEKPEIEKRLRLELSEAWPNLEMAPRWEDLEKLPYLVRQNEAREAKKLT